MCVLEVSPVTVYRLVVHLATVYKLEVRLVTVYKLMCVSLVQLVAVFFFDPSCKTLVGVCN